MQIEVENATLSFGDFNVFKGLNARFDEACVTAIVGPSGSGKSSLLAAIAGLTTLSSGNVTFVDNGVRTPPRKGEVVWVPQGSNMIAPRSALDNVMIGPLSSGISPIQAREASHSALESVGLSENAKQPVRTMSGGEIQRVGFARAIASQKAVILADEPSSSLDADNTSRLAELLRSLSTHAVVIVATHDPLLTAASHRIVRIR